MQLAKGKLILNTDICQIILCPKSGHRVFVMSESGAWIELKELPGDLKGLVNGLDLAMSVLSGKFWIKGPMTNEDRMLTFPMKRNSNE